MSHSVFQLSRLFQTELKGLYPPGEISSLSKIVLEEVSGLSRTSLLADPGAQLTENTVLQISEILQGLKQYIPVQYLLGSTEFCGYRFKVNPDVLIPRPETEELVEWIRMDMQGRRGLRILDLGTGSGNIAISLAKVLSDPEVWALDVSSKALRVAAENAKSLDCTIHFVCADILSGETDYVPRSFDLIVSNPPYIPLSQKEDLPQNVKGKEPALALFAEDKDPIQFYRSIASFSTKKLRKGGIVYCEVHEEYAGEVVDLFQHAGFKDTQLRRDLNGKNRMVKAGVQPSVQ